MFTQTYMEIMIDMFNKDKKNYNNASHKFYSIRKRLFKKYEDDEINTIKPGDFFKALKQQKEDWKNYWNKADQPKFNGGDFDDMGRSSYANKYYARRPHLIR